MKDVIIPIKLISLLADGNIHSPKEFTLILGKTYIVLEQYIQVIRNWGLDVLIIPNKGYLLSTSLQLLNESIIHTYLPEGQIKVLSIVDSTNQYFIKRIGTIQSGDACLAEFQTKGRGQRGRTWISPFGYNLYFSLYWHLKKSLMLRGLNLIIAIAIAELLQNIGAIRVRIKWPNDLYLNNSKLAGILVETSSNAGGYSHAVIGVGINLTMPESVGIKISQNWINLNETGIKIDRNMLAATLICTLRRALQEFEENGFAPFFNRWKPLDHLSDRQVILLQGKQRIYGVARGINTKGALLLEQKGKIQAYCFGEISLYTL
ncbi:birA, biotin-(acetyl-CoA-carboxylase) ligase [secondary endosymbiont of Heteropsylla cubana]|uniref:Bifunctional ligase/repressor BirA n=1 Tax=secondary endosymbiont of Heteropsylla cubana TaxID=134287 RepID=J3Z558_9ENTR|nr:bifunctional biotin--[acetyl-CoA-carboxylase] ligase/biotin operon repressor BirA [secondary endosymbiont of Heteropsylla cubana]AFP85439.1 birA, biotin-(acetyl-CoA-carboxylase) ligase [secondary endosymbiont of Heteropsylla cubana]